jgi:hypothetical protein
MRLSFWIVPIIIGITATASTASLLANSSRRARWSAVALGCAGLLVSPVPWIMIVLNIPPPIADGGMLLIGVAMLMLYLAPACLGLIVGTAIAVFRQSRELPEPGLREGRGS